MKVNEIITAKIIEALDKGNVAPWSMPWSIEGMRNAISKKLYRGVNVLLLSMFGGDNYFLTFNQAKSLGGYPLPKSGLPICFFRYLESTTQFDKKTGKPRKVPLLKYYTVHPVNKCVDLKWTRPEVSPTVFEPIAEADCLVRLLKDVPIEHGGDSACYYPSKHAIQMPRKETFKSVLFYYKTLFHEMGHALHKVTDEPLSTTFGSEVYSKEELVAEIFSSFCLNHCELLKPELFDNSTSYVANWRKALTNDASLIISAASKAQRRFDNLLGIVPATETTLTEEK